MKDLPQKLLAARLKNKKLRRSFSVARPLAPDLQRFKARAFTQA
jgi:hypothetical protein